jgi:DNA-binding MarR family transcriptional regulator
VTNAIDRTLRDQLGLPGSWYEALVEIALAGGTMRMNQFARETTLTQSGATRFVDRLETAGLVERQPDPADRRVYQLTLTAEGKTMQHAADPHVLAVIDGMFGIHLSDQEAEVLLDVLDRVRAGADTSLFSET